MLLMIQRFTPLLLLSVVFLASCKQKREDIIARKWQETAIQNAQMDEVMKSQQAFIDTVGSHTDAASNLQQYGVTNIDSFKQMMQLNMDSFKAMQRRVVEKTQFDFQHNGVVYIHSEDGVDSASWYFEEDGALMLDEQKLKGTGSQLRVEVVTLTDTLLNLRFRENNSTSNALFKPAKK